MEILDGVGPLKAAKSKLKSLFTAASRLHEEPPQVMKIH
jgi:hypothetical protein